MRGADTVCTERFVVAVGAFGEVADVEVRVKVAHPTTGVLNRPPWPYILSICTPSSLSRIAMILIKHQTPEIVIVQFL